MCEDKFRLLAKKYIQNRCSGDEARLLFEFIKGGDFDAILKEEIDKIDWSIENKYPKIDIPIFEKVMESIKKNKKPSQKAHDLIHVISLFGIVVLLILHLLDNNRKSDNKCFKVSTS